MQLVNLIFSSIYNQLKNHKLMIRLNLVFRYIFAVIVLTIIIFSLPFDESSKSTILGAIIGSLAVLLGTEIQQFKQEKSNNKKLINIKTMITLDVINIGLGYELAYKIVQSAIISNNSGGSVSEPGWLKDYLPRKMHFTDLLGSELAIIDNDSLRAISKLNLNLRITEKLMIEVSELERVYEKDLMKLKNYFEEDIKEIIHSISLLDSSYKIGGRLATEVFQEYVTKKYENDINSSLSKD